MEKFSKLFRTRTIKKKKKINAYINWTNWMLRHYDLNCFDLTKKKNTVENKHSFRHIVFKEYLIKLTIRNTRLHFQTYLPMNFFEEVSLSQEIILLWRFLQIFNFDEFHFKHFGRNN